MDSWDRRDGPVGCIRLQHPARSNAPIRAGTAGKDRSMLTLHFDYTSPASAVAVLRLQPLAQAGAAVEFRGIDALGLALPIPPTLDLLAGLEANRERARELGLTMRRPSLQPPTIAAHLVGALADAHQLAQTWRLTCLQAYFTDDVDLSDEDWLLRAAVDIGLDRTEVAAHLADRKLRVATQGRMTTQRRRGIGGVPILEADGMMISADLADADLEQLAAL